MVNVKTGQLTLGGQFRAYKRGQLERNIQSKASVMKYNGTSWEYVGIPGFSSSHADFNAIAINSSGIPYVAFVDHDPLYTGRLTVMKFNGTNWVYVGIPGFSSPAIGMTDIHFNNAGQPCVLYEDGYNSCKLTLMVFIGSSWVNWGTPGPSPENTDMWSVRFAIDPTGVPYVPYENPIQSDKLTVVRLLGSTWSIAGSLTLSIGTVNNFDICISPSGEPHVAFCDYGDSVKVSVMKFNGTDWSYLGNEGFSSDGAQSPVLAFNPYGQPDIAFVSDPLLTVMNYPLPSGISEKNSISMNIFPNPCVNILNVDININGGSKNISIEIVNLAGEKLARLQSLDRNIQIDVSAYHAGIYLIKIRSENSVWTGKFCKI